MAKYLLKRKMHYCSFGYYFIPSLPFFLLASRLAIIHKHAFSLRGQKEEKEKDARVCTSREEKCESFSFWTTDQLNILKITSIMDNGKSKQQVTVSPYYLILSQNPRVIELTVEDSQGNRQNKNLTTPTQFPSNSSAYPHPPPVFFLSYPVWRLSYLYGLTDFRETTVFHVA